MNHRENRKNVFKHCINHENFSGIVYLRLQSYSTALIFQIAEAAVEVVEVEGDGAAVDFSCFSFSKSLKIEIIDFTQKTRLKILFEL